MGVNGKLCEKIVLNAVRRLFGFRSGFVDGKLCEEIVIAFGSGSGFFGEQVHL